MPAQTNNHPPLVAGSGPNQSEQSRGLSANQWAASKYFATVSGCYPALARWRWRVVTSVYRQLSQEMEQQHSLEVKTHFSPLLYQLYLTEIISAPAVSTQVRLQDPPAGPTQHPQVRVPVISASWTASVSTRPGPPATDLPPLLRVPEHDVLLLPAPPPLGVSQLQPAVQPGAG